MENHLACLIEKHLTTSRNLGGPDADFSVEPPEFKKMVETIREVEEALGQVSYTLTEKMKRRREFSRLLFVVENIKEGEILTAKNVRLVRPGYGIPPKFLKEVLGKKAKRDIAKGSPLEWDLAN